MQQLEVSLAILSLASLVLSTPIINSALNTTHPQHIAHSWKTCKRSQDIGDAWKSVAIASEDLPKPDSSLYHPQDSTIEVLTKRNRVCVQIHSWKFKNETGWLRTKPYRFDELDAKYWFVWSMDHFFRLRIWDQDYSGTGGWELLDDTTDMHSLTGYRQYHGQEYHGREIMFDLQLHSGQGSGTSGEIALFRTKHFGSQGNDDESDDDF